MEERRKAHLLALMLDRSLDPAVVDAKVRKTRNAIVTVLRVACPRTGKPAKSPGYMGAVLWNGLPGSVRESQSRLELKELYRKYRTGLLLDREGARNGLIVVLD